ncbi:MAG: TolC family protein [Acidobacteria bacterium]|nr:TolC family protein [Acidobacteriota bacterium]
MAVRTRGMAQRALSVTLILLGLTLSGVGMAWSQTTGGDASQARRISMDEAVALALENNLDLQVERITPQVQDLSVAQVRTGYTPTFTSNINWNDQTQPPVSLLAGNNLEIVTNTSRYEFGLGALNRFGGNYNVSLNNNRVTTNNIFTNFNPQLSANVSLNYTQPLLRNFKIDGTRQQLLISQKTREISGVQLQQSIALTARNVKTAYYDLVFAISNLGAQQQSLELARQSLKDSRARVEIGTVAPIDLVQGESEVAQREESVILAEAAIARAEDRLRTLVFNPGQPDFWRMHIEPADAVSFRAIAVDTDAAIARALQSRTDLVASRKQIESNDVNIRFFKNQTMPDVSASLAYFSQGVGGTSFIRGPGGFPGPIIGQVEKSFGATLKDMFTGNFPTWTLGVQVSYPIGQANTEAALARARLQDQQARKQLQSQELQVASQIRELARQVQTNAKRVDATRASRTLAERRLEAEEKKLAAGTSTSFLVFQAQRDLNQARNNELSALLDYSKSAVDFETAQDVPLTGGAGVTAVSTAGVTGGTTTGSTASTGAGGFRQQ